MLKLEKSSRNQDITISLHDRERFLNRTMLQALGIALFLHFTAAQVFHIKLFHFDSEKGILPSTVVESQISNQAESNQSVSSYIEEEKIPLRFLLEPINSIPSTPTLLFSALIRNFHLPEETILSTKPFITLEQEMRSLSLADSTTPLAFSPISIHLSGELSGKKILSNGSTEIPNLDTLLDASSFLYQVQVEGFSGRIFWYELISKNESTFRTLVDHILSEIKLESNENGFIQAGEIEIILKQPKKNL